MSAKNCSVHAKANISFGVVLYREYRFVIIIIIITITIIIIIVVVVVHRCSSSIRFANIIIAEHLVNF